MHLRPGTHPLFVQFEELLGDLGRVERQPQAGDVELRHDVLQHLLQGQPPRGAVARRRRHRVLQDGAAQRGELRNRRTTMHNKRFAVKLQIG